MARVTYLGTMGNVMVGEHVETMANGTVIVDTGDGWTYHAAPDRVISVVDEMAAWVSTHKGHKMIVDNSATMGDDEAEDCIWCDTCDVTVWYIDSMTACD